MQSKSVGLVITAGVVSALLVVGFGLIVAWETFFPPVANRGGPLAIFQQQPQVAQNNGFNGVDFPLDFAAPLPFNEDPCPQEQLPQARGNVVPVKDCTVSGPHTHGNLAVFLIHGKDTLKGQEILTLQEALEQNVAVVHETGAGVLSIDNRGKLPLFIQSGDIVKGGTQDRTLPYDLLLAPHTNRTPLTALCVEKGRSFARGNEISTSFQSSTEQLPGRKLRLAAYRQIQQEVWNNVEALQVNLKNSVGASVKAPASTTSLQLTLETQGVQQAIQDYVVNLAPAPAGQGDVIGFAIAVNGKVHSADVYASSALFQKLWPKLMKASAVEAVAEKQRGAAADAPTVETVQAFLADAEQGQAFRRNGPNGTVLIRQESAQTMLYETSAPAQQNVVLHRTFLAK